MTKESDIFRFTGIERTKESKGLIFGVVRSWSASINDNNELDLNIEMEQVYSIDDAPLIPLDFVFWNEFKQERATNMYCIPEKNYKDFMDWYAKTIEEYGDYVRGIRVNDKG